MILGEWFLQRLIKKGVVTDLSSSCLQPGSIDLRLGDTFLFLHYNQVIELGQNVAYYPLTAWDGQLVLKPGEFCLATTQETLHLPRWLAAFVQGRSSIGRASL